MEVVIHCANCNQSLRVPGNAAGSQARCPACKQLFTIPSLDGMLEETITGWIMHDVEEMLDSKDKEVEHVPEPAEAPVAAAAATKSAPRTRRLEVGEDGKAHRRLWGMRMPTPAAHDQGVTGEAATQTATHAPPKHDGESSGHHHAREITRDEAKAHGYPTNLRIKDPTPHLVVHRVNTAGVRFVFDYEWLRDEGFRASLPVRCAFTGETDRDKLIARPLIFNDRLLKSGVNLDQIASAHSVRKLADKHPRKIVQAMGRVEALPEPFCHAMPYYVSNQYAHYALHAQTHDRSSGSITCDVLIPDPPTALMWLGRVNGVCGPEFELLERDVSLLHGSAWRQLDEDCRARLDVWCKLDPDEKFREYFNDADFGVKEAGLAGLVITDRRVLFNKHHRKGHFNLNRQNTCILAQIDGTLAHLTLEHDGERHRMVTIRAGDLEELDRLLNGERVQLMRV